MGEIRVIQTGSTRVSPAVPERESRRWNLACTGVFQRRSERIEVPVKCFLVQTHGHRFLIDAGWGWGCAAHPLRNLGFGLWYASEPVLRPEEAMGPQLRSLGLRLRDLDAVLMTHLDGNHASVLVDLKGCRGCWSVHRRWRRRRCAGCGTTRTSGAG